MRAASVINTGDEVGDILVFFAVKCIGNRETEVVILDVADDLGHTFERFGHLAGALQRSCRIARRSHHHDGTGALAGDLVLDFACDDRGVGNLGQMAADRFVEPELAEADQLQRRRGGDRLAHRVRHQRRAGLDGNASGDVRPATGELEQRVSRVDGEILQPRRCGRLDRRIERAPDRSLSAGLVSRHSGEQG